MTMRGMFGRGNINVNQSETKYLTNYWLVGLGVLSILIFDGILLAIIYFGFKASLIGLLLSVILLIIIHALLYATSSYLMRGYFREDAFDWANMMVIAITQTLTGNSNMISGALSTIHAAKKESRSEIQTELELRQLVNDLVQIRDEMRGENRSGFIPLVDED